MAGARDCSAGVYDGGVMGQPPSATNKGWWCQAEALQGFRFLHQQTGQAKYMAMMGKTMQVGSEPWCDAQW